MGEWFSNLFSGIGSGIGDAAGAIGTVGKGLLGGTPATGQNQYMSQGKDGAWANSTMDSPGSVQMLKGGNLTAESKVLGSKQINNLMDNKTDGKDFDLGSMSNNAAKLGNMYTTWQDQKMKKEYFEEWKKNNAYMKAEAEPQKKGRQGLAAELSE